METFGGVGRGRPWAEVPGIEPPASGTIEQESRPIRDQQAARKCPDTGANPANPGSPGTSRDKLRAREEPSLTGVVETALARALVLAAEVQRWDVVQQIASELEARRLARSGEVGADVVSLARKARGTA